MCRSLRDIISEMMYQLYINIAMLWCCCEAASISLSPLGMVAVCPGGQLSLTCERMSSTILYWNVSIPHPMATTRERFITSEGVLLSSEFTIGVTEFNITRTSGSPLISQLLISNVTTEINGSTIYCSEDGDENNAPMTEIIIKDDILRSMDRSLNVTMVNQLLRSDDVTIILEWPREAGAIYHISVSPEISHIESPSVGQAYFAINLTISYNVQYNVSIVSSLCGVTTTKVLKYANCGLPLVDRNLKLNYSSTLEGSVLTLTCENEMFNMNSIVNESDAEILNVTCDSNGSWIPDPADFIESCPLFPVTTLATLSQGLINKTSDSEDTLLLIILIPSTIFPTIILFVVFILSLCAIMRMCVAKKLDEDHSNEDPTYEDIIPRHQDNIMIPLEENTAYGHITHATK